MNRLLKELDINEDLTRPTKKPKQFTNVKDQIPLIADYNFMADILYLPEDKNGFKYCLVVVDLATNEFDIEPMKLRDPNTTLKAMKAMFKRNYIKKPYASLSTDSGNEFKGVFHKYLYDESILHKVALPDRHSQLSNVESLNKQLGRLFNGYMNTVEMKTKMSYKNWTDVIDEIRKGLNKIRKRKEKNPYKTNYPIPNIDVPNKYNVGDLVYRQLDRPENALGQTQPTKKFRMGDFRYDTVGRKIQKVLIYSGKIPYRYVLSGLPNVSYTESQLKPAIEKEEEFEIQKILERKKINGRIHYLIKWKGYPKKFNSYEPRKNLIDDGNKNIIDAFEKSIKNKK